MRFLVLFLVLTGLAASTGCGTGKDAFVSGTVTLDGKVLDRGTVTFHPEPNGPLAYGQVGTDGTYTLNTGAKARLEPGKYVVTVVATAPQPDPQSEAIGKLLTPPKYGDLKKTDLRFDVKPGSQRIDLPLKGS